MVEVKPFFHKDTSTFSYVVYDTNTKDAIILDSVLDFDPLTGSISYFSLKEIMNYISLHNLQVHAVLDTHVHADHMTGADYLRKNLGAISGIGEGFLISQKYFSQMYGLDPKDYERAYDILLRKNEKKIFGSLELKVLFTPGHTPACASYLINDALFCGDTLFLPHLGCGRADFPGGSAEELFESIRTIYQLPANTRIFVGHDYPKNGDSPVAVTTIGQSKTANVIINETTTKDEFLQKRKNRDKELSPPRLLWAALQVNILGGQLPRGQDGKPQLVMPLCISDDDAVLRALKKSGPISQSP